jgi:hypothetical protein
MGTRTRVPMTPGATTLLSVSSSTPSQALRSASGAIFFVVVTKRTSRVSTENQKEVQCLTQIHAVSLAVCTHTHKVPLCVRVQGPNGVTRLVQILQSTGPFEEGYTAPTTVCPTDNLRQRLFGSANVTCSRILTFACNSFLQHYSVLPGFYNFRNPLSHAFYSDRRDHRGRIRIRCPGRGRLAVVFQAHSIPQGKFRGHLWGIVSLRIIMSLPCRGRCWFSQDRTT